MTGIVEHITAPDSFDGGEGLLAILVPADYGEGLTPGIYFVTEPDQPQQLAFMQHRRGKVIEPHFHRAIPREIRQTQEILFIQRGVVEVDFYLSNGDRLCTRTLRAGDVLQLLSGGHGFRVVEDVTMFEVKQGPYLGRDDKVRIYPDPH